MRDAESLLDQLVAFKPKGLAEADVAAVLGEARGTHVAELVGAVRSGEAGKVFASLAAIFAGGIDTGSFLDQLVERFRAILAVKVCGKNADIVDLPPGDLDEAAKEAEGFTVEALLYAIQILLEAKRRVKEGANPRIVLEVTLVKLSRAADLVTLSEAIRLQPAAAPSAAPAPSARSAAAAVAAPPEDAPPPEPAVEEFKGVPTNLQEAQGAWPRVYQAVREKNVFAATILKDGRITRFAGGELVYTLPPIFKKFHLDQLELPKNRPIVESAVLTVFGRQVTIRFALDSGGSAGGETPMFKKPAPPPDTTSDPGVKKILETFGGSKIVGIE
jgi:DNA polymerase-3 subunit gamma/tau